MRQKRLLLALLNHKQALDTMMKKEALVDVSGVGDIELIEQLLGLDADSDEYLEPVLASLSKDDEEYFRDAMKNHLFAENTEDMWETCISSEVTDITIVEVNASASGTPEKRTSSHRRQSALIHRRRPQ